MSKYVVAGEAFDTQKALLTRLRHILYSYDDRQPVGERHTRFLYSLVERYHPSAELKIGCGVARIEVRRNPIYRNNWGFWIVRTDGTETDFSFMECLRPSDQLAKIRSACRNAVAFIMADTKVRFWGRATSLRCRLTGEMMTFENSHVHHAGEWPFDRIVTEFLAEHVPDIDAVELTGSKDGQIGDLFASKELEQLFIEYHNERAHLQVVSAFGNLSTAKKGGSDDSQQMTLFDRGLS